MIEEHIDRLFDLYEKLRRSGKYYLYIPTQRKFKRVLYYCKYLLKRLTVPSTATLHRQLFELLSKYPFEDADSVCLTGGRYRVKECVPKNLLSDYKLVPFENRRYMCIEKADEYLSHVYGDWRKLPPIESRVPEHFDEVYINE
nr:LicD family protein [Bacteroides sp.]